MRILAILLCLIICGCATNKPHQVNQDDLLLISIINLQTSMNIQTMEKSYDRLRQSLDYGVELRKKEVIMEDISLKVLEVIRTEFERPEAVGSSRLKEDLHFDEIDYIQLQFALEEEFNIEIPDEEVTTWKIVKDVIKTVGDKRQEV